VSVAAQDRLSRPEQEKPRNFPLAMMGATCRRAIRFVQREVWTVGARLDVMNVQASPALSAEQSAYGTGVAVALEDLEAKVTPLPGLKKRIRHRASQRNCIQSTRMAHHATQDTSPPHRLHVQTWP